MPTRKKEEADLIPNYSVQFSLNVSEFPVFRTFKKSYKHVFQCVCLLKPVLQHLPFNVAGLTSVKPLFWLIIYHLVL